MDFKPSDLGTIAVEHSGKITIKRYTLSNFDKLANDSWTLAEWLSGRLICGKCPMHELCKKYPRAECKDLIFAWLTTVDGQGGENDD